MRMKRYIGIIASAGIVALGIVGCGGSSDTTPAYAQKVAVNEEVARKAMSIFNPGYINMNMVASAEEKKQAQVLTPEAFRDALVEKIGLRDPHQADAGISIMEPVGEPDINETVDCHYSGSYHRERVSIRNASDQLLSKYELVVYTDCIHNVDLEDPEGESDTLHYIFSGSILENKVNTYSADRNTSTATVEEKDVKFKIERIADGMLLYEASGNFVYEESSDKTVNVEIENMYYDGKWEDREYNSTGGLDWGMVFEAKAFRGIDEEIVSPSKNTKEWNGYIAITNELNASKNYYLYADDFVSVYEDEDIEKETYNGVLGINCFGGAVEFATSSSWDTDESIAEVASLDAGMQAEVQESGRTPFSGKTVITGKESSVTIQFGLNDEGKAYGKFIVDGVESAPMRRSDMKSALCHETEY